MDIEHYDESKWVIRHEVFGHSTGRKRYAVLVGITTKPSNSMVPWELTPEDAEEVAGRLIKAAERARALNER